jgi:hypothetical protein
MTDKISRTFYSKVVIALLLISSIVETLITIGMFARPQMSAGQFKLAVTPDVLFLLFFMSCLMVLVSTMCWMTTWLMWRGHAYGRVMAGAYGLFWLGLGVALAAYTKMGSFLLMDSLRGALVIGFLVIDRGDQ